jgi:DNA primase
MNLLPHTPIDWRPLYKLKVKRCPICGKPDNCSGARDESGEVNLIYCRRPSENRTGLVGKPGRDGGATFILNPIEPSIPSAPRPVPSKPQPETPRAAADHVSNIYSLMLGQFPLREGHRAKLLLRGLSDAEVDRLGYVSAPSPAESDAVVESLSKYDLRGVPGFYRQAGRFRLRDLGSGIYIPVRDAQRRIRAVQIRRDEGEPRYIWLSTPPDRFEGGASSGAPVHFCRPERIRVTGEALLTEGALKSAVISFFLNCGVIGVAGVSTFTDDFGEQLKADFPELRHVTIAYDNDWAVKREVRKALFRLQATLRRAGLRWSVRKFPDAFKGYDDYLAATVVRKEAAA